jgi:hypothetical protein
MLVGFYARVESRSDVHPAWLVPLHFWRRRFFICIPRRIHQLPYIRYRRELGMVFENSVLEGKKWMLLVCGDIVHLSLVVTPLYAVALTPSLVWTCVST